MVSNIPRPPLPTERAEEGVAVLQESAQKLINGLEERSTRLGDALQTTLTLAQSHCLLDPRTSIFPTWDSWVNTMQVGSAVFRAARVTEGTAECRIHHEMRRLPATGPRSFTDAPEWIDAFWYAITCRDQERMTELCEVPLDVLRASGAEHDEYLYHWVATLQAYWLRQQPRMVEELTAAFRGSHPDSVDIAPRDWLQNISYPPINLFYRFVKHDHDGFNAALVEALDLHKRYWTASENRENDIEGLWAIDPLAVACLAYDGDFPIDVESEYLPVQMLNRSWLGEFPT